ncbi:MAG TPA: hypothetical protein VLG50_01215 [Candidatus Saccharimonadales bacterium]|nr:hypothetical protein [Candidatus Saccharimonadales bacterium]
MTRSLDDRNKKSKTLRSIELQLGHGYPSLAQKAVMVPVQNP